MREILARFLIAIAFSTLATAALPAFAQDSAAAKKSEKVTKNSAPKVAPKKTFVFKGESNKAQSVSPSSNAFVTVKGNQRVDSSAIIAYLDVGGLRTNSEEAQQKSLKKLFESDLFIDAKIYRDSSGKIIVEVRENPLVSDIKFVGNNKIEDDALSKEISLKKRGTYSKSKLQNDIKRISEIYLKSGRFLTKIEPKIIDKDQDRVEVIFDIFEGKPAKISNISFIGNDAFSDPELLEEITTKESQWWKFLSSSDIYDSDRVEFDKEKLRRFYGANGYADFAVISATAQITPEKDRFFITFLLEEGIKYKLGEINVINHIQKFDDSILQKKILIKSGKVYNADLVEKTVDGMVELMSEKSYAFADIEPVLKRNRDKKIMDIDFVIRETPRIYVNQIRIIGNTRTMDKVIRRELRFREGDPYNLTRINRSKQRIENLAFFDKVNIETKRIDNSDKVDVEVEVKEKKTGELTLGIGYSTVYKVTANAGIKERNLMGTGRELGFNVQKSAYTFSGNIDYLEPYFMNLPLDLGLNISKFQMINNYSMLYSQDSSSITTRGDYAITEFLRHSVYYSLGQQTVSNVDDSASITLRNLRGSFVSSAFGHTFMYDKRNNRINPRSGYYLSLTQELSGFGGDIKILKHEGSAGYYLPTFSDEYVLKFMARGGSVDGIGQDVRSNYSFFLGGNNFRGFEYAGMGPRAYYNGNPKGGAAIGGKMYYVGTAEFMFPLGLPKDLGINGVLFSDNGVLKGVDEINRNGTSIADSGKMRSTYGLSIVWASPMGPIRLDFSRIAKKEAYDRTQVFRFNFGTTF
jgi:outer membrane protein insertion porin family